jgi:hypothetical protein
MIYLYLLIMCCFCVSGFVFDPFRLNIPDVVINKVQYIPNVDDVVKRTDNIIHKIMEITPNDINYKIFVKMTEILPKLHSFGDNILIENEKIISNILESPVSNEVKKNVIGFVLDVTIQGDHMASDMLNMYRELVNHML